MKSRIAIMSYDKLTEAIKSTINKEELKKLIIIEASFEKTKDIAKKLWNSGEADVFVSGSSNLQMIREVISAPIVSIQISGFDIMNNFLKAKTNGGKIVIISYREPISNISIYKSILNIDVEEICYSNFPELKILLKKLRGKRIGTVIGSSLVCGLCDELGMDSIFIYSSSSIKNAITQAIQIQQSIQLEKYKSKQFYTILNYTYSGIMATDRNNIIRIYNPMAERITGIPKEKIIGQNADHVIENTRLSQVLASGRQEIDQLQNVNNRIILTSRVPIMVEGRREGVVATFQDIRSIQKAEYKIRRELHSKGLISKYSFNDIKGNSKTIKNCIEITREYADSDFTILITGESGTGKELFAHSIHNRSERRNEAFVVINCAALPESLLESELFGYERGTFTGARREGRIGLFELAHNGTILLDEIAEMPLNIQARLLRVVQEKEVMRLGSDRVITVDVRIISTTNKNLWQEVVEGRFREDLYYRLSVLELEIPSLRQRRKDILDISRDFIVNNFPNLYYAYQEKWEKIFKLLQGFDFYGNVRELQNVLKRLAILIRRKSVKATFSEEELINLAYKKKKPIRYSGMVKRKNNEVNRILETLNEYNWDKRKSAEKLGISRTTLWRKLKIYGIE